MHTKDIPKNKNKKKILYLITKSNFGGAQRYVLDLATHTHNISHDVVVVLGGNGDLRYKLQSQEIRTIIIPELGRNIRVIKDIISFVKIISILQKEKPNVVHLNSSKAGLLGALATRIYNLSKVKSQKSKVIFTAHGWAFTEDRHVLSNIFLKYFQWCTVLLSHTTIAVSPHTKKEIATLPFMQHKIKVICNGVGAIAFLDKKIARKKLAPHIPHKDTLWIGTIAELHKNKGLEYFIDVALHICTQNPRAYFVIIGEGEEQNMLSWIIKRYKLTTRVILAGYKDNAASYLKAFDIFFLPSVKEGFPYTILEAGMAELPVLASRVGGIPHAIGENGLLVTPKNTQEFETHLTTLLENAPLRARHGTRLKTHITALFSRKAMITETLRYY